MTMLERWVKDTFDKSESRMILCNSLMMALAALYAVRNESGRIRKRELLAAYDSDAMRFLLKIGLDPFLMLGVTASPVKGESELPPMVFGDFKKLINALVERRVVGKAARNAVKAVLDGVPSGVLRNLMVDILNKTPRIGADIKTVTEAIPEIDIREFNVMLASEFDESREWKFPGWIEPKYDGLRGILFVKQGTMLSRNGKPIYNVDRVIEQARRLVEDQDLVLDGELIAESFESSVGTAHRSKSQAEESLTFYIFDCLLRVEWESGHCAYRQDQRRKMLENLNWGNQDALRLVKRISVNDMDEAWKSAKKFKKEGLEGAILKNPQARYSFRRCGSWMKMKFQRTLDLEIYDLEEGRGRLAGTLGAFVCKYKGTTVRVGSGLSDELRDKIWGGNWKAYIGKTIEVLADDAETANDSLRFPRFVRFRPDKD